ncbi:MULTISPECIES: 2OG-Fe(II) oxygenase [unclassified Brevundimonas]|uniref:2OG-Fe(II) oxygenase n=1 Tax=unclassified Brevundimonas TaxID=2622653 RepID=UPI0025B81338|nr:MULTISPECIES: 2OG-Fe(II) oxygenase family protein [unclassified Brevundimonas]
MLELNPVDAERAESIKARLQRTGRAQIENVLTSASAERLLERATAAQYNVVTRKSDGHIDMPSAWLDMLNPAQKQGLAQAVQNAATNQFQYLYDNYPFYDAASEGQADAFWQGVSDFLNGETFLGMARAVTGEERIALADAQLTRFRRGHFLTEHSDEAAGKNRYYAYVLNLTPAWRIDWGGLLAFHGQDGNVDEAFTPRFNTLNLLRVPQPHSVTQVALSAGGHRISITGWLRGR